MRKAVRSTTTRSSSTGGRRGSLGRRGEVRGRNAQGEHVGETTRRDGFVSARTATTSRSADKRGGNRGAERSRDNWVSGGRKGSLGTATGGKTRGRKTDDGRERQREFIREVDDNRTRDADATANDFVAGRHPVLEALKANRPINKIVVSESSEGGSLNEILGKARAKGIIVQRVPKANLSKVAGEHHQGIIAYVAPTEYVDLSEIIQRKTGQPPLVVLLDEIADPYNLGAILRSAEATGVQGVVIPKRRAVPLTGVVAKAAAGALEYVPVARVTNLVSAMEELKKSGYWIVGTDLQTEADFTQVDYKGPTAIVIGAEGQGLSRLVKERCDYVVKMPMLGKLQSLNASVAAGVLLYEVVRQRKTQE